MYETSINNHVDELNYHQNQSYIYIYIILIRNSVDFSTASCPRLGVVAYRRKVWAFCSYLSTDLAP